MRPDPLQTIQTLIQERYAEAKAVFWSGSVANNQGTSASDLDLVIVYKALPNAYREAFIYNEWPIDAFIHDAETLHYFFEDSRVNSGIAGLIYMVLTAREVTIPSDFSESLKKLAEACLKAGPAVWDKDQIDKERFLITDALEDIKMPKSREDQIGSAVGLYQALAHFYFRSQNKWSASGKSINRYLKMENPALAVEFTKSFETVFETGNAADLEKLVHKILAPFGGLLWDGFKSHAPKEFKLSLE